MAAVECDPSAPPSSVDLRQSGCPPPHCITTLAAAPHQHTHHILIQFDDTPTHALALAPLSGVRAPATGWPTGLDLPTTGCCFIPLSTMMRGFAGAGSGRPLLAHSSDKSRRPPSPSKHGKGRGWIQRAQAAGAMPSGSGLVLLVPLLFFALAIIACVWLLHGVIVAPSMATSGPAPSVQTTSIRPSRHSLLPPVKPTQAAIGAAPAGATDAAAAAHLPSLLESSLAEINAAPAPPARPQSVEQSLRWLSHWLSLRASMDALSIDLRSHFPAPAAPEPIRVMTPLASGQVRVGWNANAGTARMFHPPPRPLPPQQGWAAGLPAFPELFLRDSFSAFLLLFPLPNPVTGRGAPDTAASAAAPTVPGYEGVWDLRPLMGAGGATAAATDAVNGASAPAQPQGFPFSALLDAHPSVASTALDDLLRMRTVLRVAARTQGTRIDARTGEEVGKIAHQLPGKDMLSTSRKGPKPGQRSGTRTVARSTRYASADSTALFVLAAVHHFHASADLALLEELLPALAAALAYLSAHVEAATGLVREHPAKFLAAVDQASAADASNGDSDGSGLDYALKVTYWKDSVLAKRNTATTGGGPAFPVTYFLLQAQTLAALRALRSLRAALAAFSPAGSEASVPMAALLRRWDAMTAAASSGAHPGPDLDGLIARVRGAMHTYFFRRAPSDRDGASTDASGADAPHSDFPVPASQPAAGSCPLFGLDRQGSLGRPVTATATALPDELRTSDFLHGLYYLERGDVNQEELEAWASAAPSSPQEDAADASAADATRTRTQQQQEEDGGAAPWEPSCFQGLETPLGYASSNLDRTPSAPTGSRPTLRRDGDGGGDGGDTGDDVQPLRLSDADRALNYHHRALWPMEQAFIHAAARRFQLRHVARVAARFFHRFERALLQHRAKHPEALDPFPEYFLPRAVAARPSAALLSAGQSLALDGGRAAPGEGALREEWLSQGAHTQLWTAAAWNYWIQAQGQRAHVLASKTAQSGAALSVGALGRAATAVSSRCDKDASAVLRGVPLSERARYCPSASTLSSSSPSAARALEAPSAAAVGAASAAPRAWPASVFACLDGSALLWLSSVNDDYCDCTDGSDERGTAACAHSDEEHSFQAPTFECLSMDRSGGGAGAARASVARIPVSMVDDGVCDCCDGSDEASEIVTCKNTCTTIRDRRAPVQSAWRT